MIKKFRFLSKLPNHRSFAYKPRYFNADKEELQKRVDDAVKASNSEYELSIRRKHKISEEFHRQVTNKSTIARVQHQKSISNIRFVIILNILLIIAIYVAFKLL